MVSFFDECGLIAILPVTFTSAELLLARILRQCQHFAFGKIVATAAG
jgi:hypothetical protein